MKPSTTALTPIPAHGVLTEKLMFFNHFQGLNGQYILEQIESGYRLECPEGVPQDVYKIMKSCWEFR